MISHLVAFENLEEILNLMVMNGNTFQRLMIPYIRQKFFQVNCCLYWQDISKTNGQQ
jgi:hypothetical protein